MESLYFIDCAWGVARGLGLDWRVGIDHALHVVRLHGDRGFVSTSSREERRLDSTVCDYKVCARRAKTCALNYRTSLKLQVDATRQECDVRAHTPTCHATCNHKHNIHTPEYMCVHNLYMPAPSHCYSWAGCHGPCISLIGIRQSRAYFFAVLLAV